MPNILVVDDEPDVVEYLSDLLDLEGYRVEKAYDGVEAVLSVIDGGIDAVLMDIRMPRVDGVSALRIIKRLKPGLPVIMFTGQAGQGDMAETTRLGAYSCLLKPVTSQKLISALEQIFSGFKSGL